MAALVVHDDAPQAKFVSGLLADEGFEVSTVERAALALERMDPNAPPALLLTSLHLPEMDAWGFCHLLRSQAYQAFNQVPILVISAAFTAGEPPRIAAELGAVAFLSSPVDKGEMRGQVQKLLRGELSRKPTRALIVEDDAALAELLKAGFDSRGWQVDTAGTGLEAQERFQAEHYDVVILDHHLPDTAGNELLTRLKPLRPETVYIAMTGDRDPALALDWMRRGAAAFVRKPVTASGLFELCTTAQQKQELVRLEDRLEARTRELRQSEAEFQAMFQFTSVGMAQADPNTGYFLRVNPRMCAITGYAAEELLQKPISEITHPEDRSRDADLFRRVVQGELPEYRLEKRYIRKDGSIAWVNVNMTVIRNSAGQPLRTLATIEEITERKLVERAFQEQESHFRGYFELGLVGMAITSLEKGWLHFNDCMYTMLGYSREELGRMTWSAVTHPEDLSKDTEQFNRVLRGEIDAYALEKRFLRKDGSVLHTELSVKCVRREDGSVDHFLAMVRDSSERKRAEQAIRESEERYRQLVESSPAPILAHQNGRFVFANAAALTLFGACTSEELLRSPVLDRVHPDFRHLVQERIQRMALSGGSVPAAEEKLLRMDGSVITAEVAATSYGYQDQTAVQVVIRDVTAQKDAETALRKSKQRYEELVASIPVGIYTMRSTREAPVAFDYVSPKVGELFGISVESFLADPQSAFAPIHPDDVEGLVQLNLERYRDLQDFEWEGRAILKGMTRWLRIESQPELQADGTILWNGIISDITERKAAETQLRQSEARHRDLYNKTPVMLHSIDREGRLIGVSDYWLASLGYSREEVMGRPSTDFLTQTSRRYAAEVVLPEFRKTGQCQNVEYQYVRKDGRVLDCLLSAISERDESGQVVRSLAVITDVSERKRAEEAFKESSLFNQQIIRDAREGIVVFGPDLRYRVWNPFMEQISGLSAREVLGRTPLEVFPFLRETGMMESLENALRGEPSEPLEFPFHIPETGYSGWTSNSRGPLRNAKGDIIGVIATVQDITGRKLAEAALQESERRLRLACQSAKLGVWDWDVVQNRITWDDQMFELYGMAKEATAFGVEIWEQGVHPEDRASARTACQEALRGEKEYDVEFRVQRPDGTIRHVKADGLVVRNQEGKAIRMLGINYDITERKELEGRLRQAQKMEAIGQLAGGVAHDFNNILAAIMMYLSLLRRHPKLEKEVEELLMNVGTEAKRAAVLVRQLLLFSRRTAMQVKPTELNDIIRGMMKMLSRLIGEHISIQSSSHGGEIWIEADSGMMEQVLMNLVVNARDAMPKGGRLYLTTCKRDVGEDRMRAQPEARAGKYACLTVRDTGCGMDEAILPHIFEPFFTTKDVGKGTGLGLATVHGIVKQHHGWIEVDSAPGRGTEFRLFFPLHATAIQPCDKSEAIADVPRGTETLLVVEDEAALRRVTVSWLRSIGYDVLEAANGREAIQHWSHHKERIQLLLSDMVMPEGMTGLELAELCRAENPDLKIIISSGYSTEHSVTSGTTGKGLVYLPKPYDSQVLANVIRDSLNKPV